jgi:hypothetical protein
MITPQVPTGSLIGQTVLHDESDSQSNHAMSVMGSGQGQIGHIRVEVFATTRATMLGVNEMDVVRPTRNQIAQVMQGPLAGSAAEAGFAATRTGTMREVPAAIDNLGLGEVFDASDAFRGIG